MAFRTLWEWRRAEPEEEPNPFDDLYADDLTSRRRERTRRFPVHPGLLKGKPHAAGLPQTRYRSRGSRCPLETSAPASDLGPAP
jgi:hypothetical protein